MKTNTKRWTKERRFERIHGEGKRVQIGYLLRAAKAATLSAMICYASRRWDKIKTEKLIITIKECLRRFSILLYWHIEYNRQQEMTMQVCVCLDPGARMTAEEIYCNKKKIAHKICRWDRKTNIMIIIIIMHCQYDFYAFTVLNVWPCVFRRSFWLGWGMCPYVYNNNKT